MSRPTGACTGSPTSGSPTRSDLGFSSARRFPADPSGMHRAARGSVGFLGCGAVGLGLYVAGPAVLAAPLFLLTAVASIAATVVGTLRLRRGSRRPWWAIVGAETAFLGGAVLRLVVPGAGATPPGPAALVPDVLVVPGYALLAYGLLDMLRRRRAVQDEPARADAALLGLGAALAAWTFLIAPRLDAATVPAAIQLTAALFPMVDVLLLVIVTQLIFADGVRKPALWLVGAATSAMFLGDLLYALREDGLHASLPVLDLLFLAAFLTIGAAALHPTMRTLAEPQPAVLRGLGAARTAGLAAVLVAPNVLALLAPPPTWWNALVRLMVSVLLAVMISVRVVKANNSRARAERAARHRATHDPLTGLPNREQLAETIDGWLHSDPEVSLLFIDLDRFKGVNDTWGHEVGDELLRAVAGRLRNAVREDDLVCRPVGVEALMRGDHPVLGRVSPLEFIPIAEDTGLIVPYGAWLLEEAAAQLVRWQHERPPTGAPLHISVNLSVRQLQDSALVDTIRGVLDRTGLPASGLWLEITESGVIEDPEGSLAALHAIRELGVTLCLDDFGTGYSSLTYLRRFPAGIVKIDRAFVDGVGQDCDDEAIVRTVIAMAHALGQQVVAEGVETALHRDWLRAHGCDLAQGWFYGAARPAAAQSALLRELAAAPHPLITERRA